MSNTNIERILIEMAETEVKVQNIAGFTFSLITLTQFIREDFSDCKTNEDVLILASELGLAIKGERASDYKGMTQQKLELFWSREEFDVVEGEPSIRERFGEAVLRESNMLDLLEDESEELDIEGELDELAGEELEVGPDGRAVPSGS